MRAFGETPRFQEKCGKNIDNFSRSMMCQFTIGRWLSVRLQGLGCVTLFFTALAVTVFPAMLDAGLAGLAINYAMMVSGTLQGFIESFTELELKMNGIERVKFYTEVATEKPYEKDTQAKLNDAARRCASLAIAPLPLIFSYKSQKSLWGTGWWRRRRAGRSMGRSSLTASARGTVQSSRWC